LPIKQFFCTLAMATVAPTKEQKAESLCAMEARVAGVITKEYEELAKKKPAPHPLVNPQVRYDNISQNIVLRSRPHTQEEWRRTCRLAWLDADKIHDTDPFWLAQKKSPDDWESFYYFVSESERRMLSALQSTAQTATDVPEQQIGIQQCVLRGSDGAPNCNYVEMRAVGCTRRFAAIILALEHDKEQFLLFTMRIDNPEPSRLNLVRSVRSNVPAATTLRGTHVQRELDEKMVYDIAHMKPLYELQEDGRLPGRPLCTSLDPESGAMAVVCEGKEDRVIRIMLHADKAWKEEMELPCARPSKIAISPTHVAAQYDNCEIPHVQIAKWGDPLWNIYAPLKSEEPDADGAIESYTMTFPYFNRALPHILNIGTETGETLCVNGDTGKESRPPYMPPALQDYAVHVKKMAERSPHPEKVLREMQSPAQQVLWINWGKVGTEEAPEPRVLIGYHASLGFADGTPATAELQLAIGKKPYEYICPHSPIMCAEAYGGVMAIYCLETHLVELIYTSKIQLRMGIQNSDVTKEMGVAPHPYPALCIFTQRVVIQYPNGFVCLVELMSEEQKKEYSEALKELMKEQQEKILAESLKGLSVKEAKEETAAALASVLEEGEDDAHPPK
jgi:hypothetical protein